MMPVKKGLLAEFHDTPISTNRFRQRLYKWREGLMKPTRRLVRGEGGRMTKERVRAPVDPETVKRIDASLEYLEQFTDADGNMPLHIAEVFRLTFDDFIKASTKGNFSATIDSSTLGEIKRIMSNNLRRELNSVDPRMGLINRDMSFWLILKEQAEKGITRQVGKSPPMLKRGVGPLIIAGGAGAMGVGGGMMTGAGALVVTGVLGSKVADVVNTPAFAFASAKLKTQLADAIMTGNLDHVSTVLARITAVMQGNRPNDPPLPPGHTRRSQAHLAP
jgi:hypothetical protein